MRSVAHVQLHVVFRRVGEGGEVSFEVSRELIRKQVTIVASWTFSSLIQAD